MAVSDVVNFRPMVQQGGHDDPAGLIIKAGAGDRSRQRCKPFDTQLYRTIRTAMFVAVERQIRRSIEKIQLWAYYISPLGVRHIVPSGTN